MTATLDTATPVRPRHIACPRCTAPMHALTLPTHRRQPITVDHCPDCRLVWFDELESVQLDGLGWVRLLRRMEDGRQRPLADAAVARPACPACTTPLKAVQNRTRYGLFAALECPQRHGHLHSHSGLLAERGLVRPLGAAERRALAQEKHRLHCFNCGAPAAASDDQCSYCRTALVVLDLPRLAHSLRPRDEAMAASPTAPGRHAVWSCRGCGAALDPGRQTSCPHCSHLVVAQELPDVLPLLEAAEAEQAAAAELDAQRRARFPSAQRPHAARAAPTAPPRALTRRPPPRPSMARTLMLAGWLPLLLLLAAALLLAATAAADVPLRARTPAEALRAQRVGDNPRALWGWVEAHRALHPGDDAERRQLQLGLFDLYTRQISGDPWPARATVGQVIDGTAGLPSGSDRDADPRLNLALARQLRLVMPTPEAPLPETAARPSGRLASAAPGVWLDPDMRGDALWLPTIENAGPATLVLERLAVRHIIRGPDGVGWRCQPAAGASPVLKPGQRLALVCGSTVLVRLQEDGLWGEAMYQLNGDVAPKLLWEDEGLRRTGAWQRVVDHLVADGAQVSAALAVTSPPLPMWRQSLRELSTKTGWKEMSTPRRQALGLAALLVAFVGFCALARWLGERRARLAWLAGATPLCYLAGRGDGAASVLLVGMYLVLAVLLAFACQYAYRLYRDLVFSRFA